MVYREYGGANDQIEVDRMAVDQGWTRIHGSRYADYAWAYVRGGARLEVQFSAAGRLTKARYSGPERAGIYADKPVRAQNNEYRGDYAWELLSKEKLNRVRRIFHMGPEIKLKEPRYGTTWHPLVYSLGKVEPDGEGGSKVYGRDGGGYRRTTLPPDEVRALIAEGIAEYEKLVGGEVDTEGAGIES